MCPFPGSSFESGGWLDGTYCCDTPGRQPDHRFISLGVIAKTFPVDKVHAIYDDRKTTCPARSPRRQWLRSFVVAREPLSTGKVFAITPRLMKSVIRLPTEVSQQYVPSNQPLIRKTNQGNGHMVNKC